MSNIYIKQKPSNLWVRFTYTIDLPLLYRLTFTIDLPLPTESVVQTYLYYKLTFTIDLPI